VHEIACLHGGAGGARALVRRCEMCSRKKLSAMTTETQTTLPTTASEMRAKNDGNRSETLQ
jgi:hypothetical protein